jgi:hypothetical protein
MLACLKDIRDGKKTNVPVYDFITNARYAIKDCYIYGKKAFRMLENHLARRYKKPILIIVTSFLGWKENSLW